jgi:hypothetical protein
MAVRNTRQRRFHLEALERREVLSAAVGIPQHPGTAGQPLSLAEALQAHLVIPSAPRHAFSFVGQGKTALLTATPLADGSLVTTSSVLGQVTQLGIYSGQLTVKYSPNRLSFTGGAVLNSTITNGDQIFLNISAATRTRNTITTHLQATFQVLGGTGRFAGATGSGTLDGIENTQSLSELFIIHGTIIG